MSKMPPSLYHKKTSAVVSPINKNKLFVKTVILDVGSATAMHSPLIEQPELEEQTSSPLARNKINRKNYEI
jgi:hypothetical protein